MSTGCAAALQGRQAELPGKKQKRVRPSKETTLLIAQSGTNGSAAILVERRPASGLWGGLWSPPQFENAREALAWCEKNLSSAAMDPQALPPIDHAFTHFDLRLNPVVVQCAPDLRVFDANDQQWYPLDTPPRIGLPQPIHQLFERLRTSLERIG
jgi:A/G-specific adenine glycosylase